MGLIKGKPLATLACDSATLMFAGVASSFMKEPGYIGAFPTYDEKGHITLRPVSRVDTHVTETETLIGLVNPPPSRRMKSASCETSPIPVRLLSPHVFPAANHCRFTCPDFCPVCLESLYLTLLSRLSLAESISTTCTPAGRAKLRVDLLELDGAEWDVKISRLHPTNSEGVVQPLEVDNSRIEADGLEEGKYRVGVKVKVPEIRKDDAALRFERVVAVGDCEIRPVLE